MTNTIHTHTIPNVRRAKPAGCVLAIGNMDGVHPGHAALLKTTYALAEAAGQTAAVLTFEPHPRMYFNPKSEPLNLLKVSSKIATIQQYGISTIFIARFNKALANMPAEPFITDYCVSTLNAHHIVTGTNFYFGKGRAGNAELMADVTRSIGVGYSCVEPVCSEDGEIISSTRIRNLLKVGNVREANQLLGHPYSITGRVIHGDKRGSQLGFPTANIPVGALFHPAYGAYAVHVTCEGKTFQGVANLGIRPTFNAVAPMLEVHLFNYNGSLYGKRMQVELKHFIRPEQKFTSAQSMIDQLNYDVVKAKEFLAHNDSHFR